jgi:hypothetical protein
VGNDTLVAVDLAKSVLSAGRFGPAWQGSPSGAADTGQVPGVLRAAAKLDGDHGSVPIKSVTQQVLGTLHRLRSGWVGERTARVNALRGLLRELGFFIPPGRREVLPHAWELIQDAESGLPDALRPSLAALCEEVAEMSERIEDVEKQLNALAQQQPAVARVYSVPGIGILMATEGRNPVATSGQPWRARVRPGAWRAN